MREIPRLRVGLRLLKAALLRSCDTSAAAFDGLYGALRVSHGGVSGASVLSTVFSALKKWARLPWRRRFRALSAKR